MKIITLGLLLFLAASGAFAETSQRVAIDAELLLGQQTDRSAEYQLFLETSILANYENRIKLNEYRTKFNALSGRIYILRNQITVALNVREPRIETVSSLRQQLQNLINEHDTLLDEFRTWVATLR